MPISSTELDKAVEVLSGILSEHEVAHHAGEACLTERLNMIAWVAHRIGWRPRTDMDLFILKERIEAYWKTCPHANSTDHDHSEGNNGKH